MCKENLLSGVIGKIVTQFYDGSLISHDWLKRACGLEMPDISDYDTSAEFIVALQAYQFSYMTLVDELRDELLKSESMYLKNERGEGYVILKPEEQVQYGYDSFIDKMNKMIKTTTLIINNVREVSNEQRSKDNDLRAKFALMQSMLKSVRKKSSLF